MYVLNTTDDYHNITFTNCTNIENKGNFNVFKQALFSIPSNILLCSLKKFLIRALIKP